MQFHPAVVFEVVDLLGVAANGVLGGVLARRMKMDLVGFVFLAIVSGLGGGLLRDTLLQGGLPVALADPAYLTTALAAAAAAYLLPLQQRWTRRGLLVADSLSVGCWAATGTSKALAAGLGWLPALLLGMVTAVGGGMIRDVAVGRLPAIFGGNTLYATSALVASAEMLVLTALGRPTVGMAVAIGSSAALSLAARRFGWRLPGPANLSPEALRRLRDAKRAEKNRRVRAARRRRRGKP